MCFEILNPTYVPIEWVQQISYSKISNKASFKYYQCQRRHPRPLHSFPLPSLEAQELGPF